MKAYEFLNVENRFSMLIEDFGGISLDHCIKDNQFNLREFLYIALEVTKGLDYIHKNHIIHKDINPSNIVYNANKKIIKLIDFGVASEFSFETMQALNPNKLEGRLAYISPEQTGRMNRPVDYRTDFYSLGVTLYELACGKLPIISDDPAEIVHFHIAKKPLQVNKINPEIPIIVSKIINKLMAKMPEDRYKNAQGIIFDLQQCMKQLDNGVIKEFELGTKDISNKLEVPKKLYGRENELEKLLASFENISKGSTEFILIGGYSGIGKTSLVNELHKPIMKEHGIFISGKYDQFNRNTPYSACYHAINQFCSYILSESEIEIKRWKNRISEALGSNGRLITEVVPRLELIIGEQPILGEMSAIEEQTRFKVALKNWIAVISAPEHPVVFFMDDVHWADMASLELFESLLMDHSIKGLMFIGTYRDNEVDSSHPLIRSLEKVKKNNEKVDLIKVENLNIQAVAQIISDIVSRPEQEILQLARLVHERTRGNPFYTIKFLKHCNEEKLLYFDPNEVRWKWNASGVYKSKISDNVADYLIGKIEQLPEDTRDLVRIAACIGNHFDLKVLSNVAGKDPEIITDALKPAIYEEMIYFVEEKEDDLEELQFEFCHDKFQQAGYQSLSENIKKEIHLNIARYYEANEVLEGKYLFIVADHYSKALDCSDLTQEIEKVIEIFFKAVHTANLSCAYDTARQYLELILAIAPQDLRENESFLLRVYTEYHLVLFSLARFEELDQTYSKVEVIAKDPLDLVDCCCLQVISLSNRSRYKEGFELGIALLEKLGIRYPQDELIDVVEAEYEKYCEYERNGSIANIEKKEMLRDIKGKAIAKLLNRIVPAAQFFNPLAAFWATLVNANLMVENGVTSLALEMSWGFFMGIIAYKNDFRCGNILAAKAMHIVEQEGFNAELYRMYHFNGLARCHWFEPVEKDIYFAHEAYKGNLQNGEFEFSCYSFFTSQAAILECCNTISEMQDEIKAALSFANRMGNVYGLESFVSFQQIVRALKGETFAYGSFNDEYFDEQEHIERVQHNAIGLAYYYIYRSLGAVLFGDFTMAFRLTEKAIPLIPYIASFYTAGLLRFLHSLAICKIIEEMKDIKKKNKLIKVLEVNQNWMHERAQDASVNFQHLYDLVAAELKAIEGKYDESFRLYEKAISGAKENNRPYHYALACELAGQRYHKTGIERIASFYLKEAYSAFLAWGATGKVEAMKEKYHYIIFSGIDSAKLVGLTSGADVLNKSININALTNSIDINAVIQASQTISVEIEQKKLLGKLMTIIIENSGSNRGHILTKDGINWILSAYEILNKTVKIYIDNQRMFFKTSDTKILPLSIISYVIRTQEPVIIGNILNSQFLSDPYFLEHTTLSVMCFPIIYNNRLKGIIYLENDLLTEAFNRKRLNVLNIFASQAAISLENSILYSNLEEKVKERTKQLQQTNGILKQRTDELAIAKEKTEVANMQLNMQNLKLQHQIIRRKKVEEELRLNLNRLRLSEERFGKMFHNSPVMMSIRTQNQEEYLDVNPRWEEVTGFSRNEVVGRSLSELGFWEDEVYWPEVIKELNEKGVKRNTERVICIKSGEFRTFLISQTAVNINNQECWLSASIDITERKKMEKEIARLDRLNMVGEMAASIGHEIRNPMTSVRGFLQLFKDKYSEDIEFLNLMIDELDRANSIITEFLSLAKNKIVELEPTNLNRIINKILPLIQVNVRIQDKSIKIEIEDIPNLLLDEKEIRQLILNLVNNGLEAMKEDGLLTISTYKEGDNIILSIEDQGHGIDPELLDKLGTPFFTTKEKGTGLGLAVCYGIAARHNAKIDFQTSSSGTIFYVRFPV